MAKVDQVYATRFRRKFGVEDELNRYVAALYEMLGSVLGQDKLVLRAGKVNALKMMRSQNLPDRLCGLQRLVLEDPTLERATTRAHQRKAIAEIEEAMAEVIAQRHAEDAIERRVNEKMAERHQEYVKDLKLEALRETGGPETPGSQAKLEELEALSQRGLAASALAQLRPQTLRDVVGQEAAIRALLAKISSPYPATRDSLRAAGRRQDDRRAARRGSRQVATPHAVSPRTRPSSKRAERRCAGIRARRSTRS